MRLPRVRISLRTLLIVVAVAALDCGVVRILFEEDAHGASRLSEFLELAIGFLPLVHVALIGTLLLAVRRLRAFRRLATPNPRPTPAGITFFSIHFLALGGVACSSMPDAMQDYLDTAMACTADWLLDVVHPLGLTRDILYCVAFGVILSGPPLLLSWIGRLLARRCARTLPPWRFRMLTGLVSLGFAGVAFAIAVTPQPFREMQDVELDFQVVDQDSGRPIHAAFLMVSDPFKRTEPRPPRAITGADGRACLAGCFEAVGERNVLYTMGVYSPWGRWLEISAPDYATVRIPLTEVLGPAVDLGRPRPRRVALIKGKTPESSFRDIAGTYTRGSYHGGSEFVIEPDGRFAFFAHGCRGGLRELGHLKRNGKEIELVPVLLPGEETSPWMTVKYLVVPWGDRRYLSIADSHALDRFCWASLTRDPSAISGDTYDGWVCGSGRDAPSTGWPRLPLIVWVRFFLRELTYRGEPARLAWQL